MQQKLLSKIPLKVAVSLGASALVVNGIVDFIFSAREIAIGNIFLFIAASVLSVPGLILSLAVATIPDVIVNLNYFSAIKLLILCTAINYCARKHKKIPSFIVAMSLWLLVIAPLAVLARSMDFKNIILSNEAIFFSSLSDVVMVLISGLALLNGSVWQALTGKSRQVQISDLIIHVVTCCSSLILFAVLSAVSGSTALPSQVLFRNINLSALTSLTVLSISISAFLAWRLSEIISNNFYDFFGAKFLSSKKSQAFSGLSSEFWRRQTSANDEFERVSSASLPSSQELANSTDSNEQLGGATKKIQSADVGLCALNRNGTITFLNRKFRKFCEITSNDVIGKNIDAIGMNRVLCKKILGELEATFLNGPRVSEVKINELPEKLRFYEIKTENSDAFENSTLNSGPDSVIVNIKDITDKRTLESHLLQAKKLESMGSMIEGIAHSFNNSLMAISGQASFAKFVKKPEQVDKALDEILKATVAAGTFVRQLIDFASNQPTLMKQEELENLLQATEDFLKPICNNNQQLIITNDTKNLSLNCDSNLLKQALTNLVLNAKEAYRNESGKILLDVALEEMQDDVTALHAGARPGKFIRFRVRDFGQGMSPDTLAKAFDPLFTTKNSSGNTGLGLSIVFAIVKAHDGFLTAESHAEKGTSITMYIPLNENPKVTAEIASNAQAENNSSLESYQNKTILVVEDETSIRDLVSDMLSNLGYKVTSCSDGEEALDKATANHFDLILIDMVIPKIKGLDLVAKLKESSAETKTLLMTGYSSSPTSKDKTLKVIHKPFDIHTLDSAVKSCLSKI